MRELMAAGLDSLPGGGAEIFAPRVRRKISADKADADRYLAIHGTAHRLGMRTNVTMLYGHIETMEERVDHMLRARERSRMSPEDSRRSSRWRFIPTTTRCASCRRRPAPTRLKVHAVSRLMLDNIPHIKAFWIATGLELAQQCAVVRRGRSGRHRAGREDLPHGRFADARGHDDGRAHQAGSRHRPRAATSATRSTTSSPRRPKTPRAPGPAPPPSDRPPAGSQAPTSL